jgi:hypothetical protein
VTVVGATRALIDVFAHDPIAHEFGVAVGRVTLVAFAAEATGVVGAGGVRVAVVRLVRALILVRAHHTGTVVSLVTVTGEASVDIGAGRVRVELSVLSLHSLTSVHVLPSPVNPELQAQL